MTKRAGKRRPMVRRGDSGSSQQLNAVLVNASERSIAIDVSRLAPPQNIYDADCAGVEHRRGDVRLFFGKLKLPRRDQLRSRIEIRLSGRDLLQAPVAELARFSRKTAPVRPAVVLGLRARSTDR